MRRLLLVILSGVLVFSSGCTSEQKKTQNIEASAQDNSRTVENDSDDSLDSEVVSEGKVESSHESPDFINAVPLTDERCIEIAKKLSYSVDFIETAEKVYYIPREANSIRMISKLDMSDSLVTDTRVTKLVKLYLTHENDETVLYAYDTDRDTNVYSVLYKIELESDSVSKEIVFPKSKENGSSDVLEYSVPVLINDTFYYIYQSKSFFSESKNEFGLYSHALGSKDENLLVELSDDQQINYYQLKVFNNHLYLLFSNNYDPARLYKVDIEAGQLEDKHRFDPYPSEIKLEGDQLVFLSRATGQIFKARLSGDESTQITEDSTYIGLFGSFGTRLVWKDDLIIFMNEDDKNRYYSVTLDGSDLKRVSDKISFVGSPLIAIGDKLVASEGDHLKPNYFILDVN